MCPDASPTRSAAITVRATPDDKLRFASLARRRGVSESQLALIAVKVFLDAYEPAAADTASKAIERIAASDRITIRLRPGDRGAIVRRAHRRGMRASAYLAALVRAHLAADPPLASAELAALKSAVSVLVQIERRLATLAGAARREGASAHVPDELGRLQAELGRLEQLFHDFARAALCSWESTRG